MVNQERESRGLESEVSESELKEWRKEWRGHHMSLPDRYNFGPLTFYKQDKDSGLYSNIPPEKPLRRRRWYCPFWKI